MNFNLCLLGAFLTAVKADKSEIKASDKEFTASQLSRDPLDSNSWFSLDVKLDRVNYALSLDFGRTETAVNFKQQIFSLKSNRVGGSDRNSAVTDKSCVPCCYCPEPCCEPGAWSSLSNILVSRQIPERLASMFNRSRPVERLALPNGSVLQGVTERKTFSIGTVNGLSFDSEVLSVTSITGTPPKVPHGFMGLGRWKYLKSTNARKSFLQAMLDAGSLKHMASIGAIDNEDLIVFGNFERFLEETDPKHVLIGEPVSVSNWFHQSEWNVKLNFVDVASPGDDSDESEGSHDGEKLAPEVLGTEKVDPLSYKTTFDIGSAFNIAPVAFVDNLSGNFDEATQGTLFGKKAYKISNDYCVIKKRPATPRLKIRLGDEVDLELSASSMIKSWGNDCYLAFLGEDKVAPGNVSSSNPPLIILGEPFFKNFVTSLDYDPDVVVFREITNL